MANLRRENGYHPGITPSTYQELFKPYVYRGNGPFINPPKPKPKPERATGIATLIGKAEAKDTTAKDKP